MLRKLKFDFEKVNWTFHYEDEEAGTKYNFSVPKVPERFRELYEALNYYVVTELYDLPAKSEAKIASFAINPKFLQVSFGIQVSKSFGEFKPQSYNLEFVGDKDVDALAEIQRVWQDMKDYFVDNLEAMLLVPESQTKFTFA